MGYTRSRRYANHKSGRKYKQNPQKESSKEAQLQARKDILPNEVDPVKAKSAAIFKEKWTQAKTNEKYLQLLKKHKVMYEQD
jgi:putative heme degradation protein